MHFVHKFNAKKASVKQSLSLLQQLASKGSDTAQVLVYGLSQLLEPNKLDIGIDKDIELFKHYCFLVEKLQQLPESELLVYMKLLSPHETTPLWQRKTKSCYQQLYTQSLRGNISSIRLLISYVSGLHKDAEAEGILSKLVYRFSRLVVNEQCPHIYKEMLVSVIESKVLSNLPAHSYGESAIATFSKETGGANLGL